MWISRAPYQKRPGLAYGREINVADHLHNVRDLISGDDTSPLALGTDLYWHTILIGLKYSGLMETDRRGVNIHVTKNDVSIRYSSRQSQMRGQRQRSVE